MIKIIESYRIQNLEDELERLETKIINNKTISRYDLRELEGLSNQIMYLRMRMSELIKEDRK